MSKPKIKTMNTSQTTSLPGMNGYVTNSPYTTIHPYTQTMPGTGGTHTWIEMSNWDVYNDPGQRYNNCQTAKQAILGSIAYGDLSRELAIELLVALTHYLENNASKPEVEVSI